jgi:hypothetical protein
MLVPGKTNEFTQQPSLLGEFVSFEETEVLWVEVVQMTSSLSYTIEQFAWN